MNRRHTKSAEPAENTVNVNEKIATEEFIRVTGENDIDLSVWTVNDEERFRELLGQGVKNITTRNVKMACEVRSCEPETGLCHSDLYKQFR